MVRGATSPAHVLIGLLRCGRCGASHQLETSGKRVEGKTYRYSYYNCRTSLRVGKEACPGHRIPTAELDAGVLAHLADAVCTSERALGLQRRLGWSRPIDELVQSWRALITADPAVGRTYLRHLVEQIVVDENRIAVVPRASRDAQARNP